MKKLFVLLCVLCLPVAMRSQSYCEFTTTADGSQSLAFTTGKTSKNKVSARLVTLHRNSRYQVMDGFGYALTYSACYNLLKMSPPARHRFLVQTFSNRNGYGASYVRMSIGCNDFSSTEYTLCDKRGSKTLLFITTKSSMCCPF